MDCSVKHDKSANIYQFMITEEPITEASVWTSYTSTRSKLTISGLKSGKQYWVKIAILGSGALGSIVASHTCTVTAILSNAKVGGEGWRRNKSFA